MYAIVYLTFQGHPRSTKRSPSCSPYMICYKCLMVTIDLVATTSMLESFKALQLLHLTLQLVHLTFQGDPM